MDTACSTFGSNVHTEFLQQNLKDDDHSKDLEANGITLKTGRCYGLGSSGSG
jgi:hypothetical protein